MNQWLVFTDLDGSLLDHNTYSHQACDTTLDRLDRLHTPVILATSKTRFEVIPFRKKLGNKHPFITENGAAIYIPVAYFPQMPKECVEQDGYWVYALSKPRSYWLALLAEAKKVFPTHFSNFANMQAQGIAEATGLSISDSTLANKREYSEPIQWFADDDTKQAFVTWLTAHGGHVLQGGRFLHLSGDCNKGKALSWLLEQFRLHARNDDLRSLAIGDGDNDIAMLEIADHAIVIRSPAHPPPQLTRTSDCLMTTLFGPEGWAEGVNQLITDPREDTHG